MFHVKQGALLAPRVDQTLGSALSAIMTDPPPEY